MGTKTQRNRLTKEDIFRALVDLRNTIERVDEIQDGEVVGFYYRMLGKAHQAVTEADRIIARMEKEC
jgi:hypothetical protein